MDHQREPWDHAADFEVVSFEYNTLVLFLADGGLRIGAASGDTVSKTLVLNLLNGEPFELKDVFRAGYQQPLLELAKARAFCDSKRQTSAEPMEVRDDQQFFIKEGALALVYQRREICAGVFGPTVITIEGSALRPLLNPNGPLGYLV